MGSLIMCHMCKSSQKWGSGTKTKTKHICKDQNQQTKTTGTKTKTRHIGRDQNHILAYKYWQITTYFIKWSLIYKFMKHEYWYTSICEVYRRSSLIYIVFSFPFIFSSCVWTSEGNFLWVWRIFCIPACGPITNNISLRTNHALKILLLDPIG